MEQNQEITDDSLAQDALPLCPKCLKPYNPRLTYYCPNCDSNEPLNPLASYMPFVRIRFAAGMFGNIWRRLWTKKHIPLILRTFYILMIVLGAPIMLTLGLPFILISKIKNPQLHKAAVILCFILLFILFILFLMKINPPRIPLNIYHEEPTGRL